MMHEWLRLMFLFLLEYTIQLDFFNVFFSVDEVQYICFKKIECFMWKMVTIKKNAYSRRNYE